MRRFYDKVDVAAGEEGWSVRLDGRPVKTPAKRPLVLPSEAMARGVAEEWAAQAEEVRPETMPLGRLATSAIDLMPERRGDVIEEVMAIARADMLCYRALSPAELARRQRARWQPWLAWAEEALAAAFTTTDSLAPVEQPPGTLNRLRQAVAALGDWRLLGVHAATRLTGSALLALAIERGRLGADEAVDLALLEERYEIELWGLEEEQAERHRILEQDLAAACRFLRLLDDV